MSRFDYIKYDDVAMGTQLIFKANCELIEGLVNDLPDGRAKSLALTKLEEVYMWVGKAIRDDQIKRNAAAPLQEERSDS